MTHLFTFIALDIARSREAEAREMRLVRQLAASDPDARRNPLRRGLAMTLAAVSRSSARAARRLDDGAISPAR